MSNLSIVLSGENTRYELIDGELRDMEPTGPHEEGSGNIAGRIYVKIIRDRLNWLIPKNCLIKPLNAEATVLRPDMIVLDKTQLNQEPLVQKNLISCHGTTLQLVVEVSAPTGKWTMPEKWKNMPF